VDIRELQKIVFGRWDSLRSLALVPADAVPPRTAVALELLEGELSIDPTKENQR
jgi:hypothetical protein